MMNLPDQRRRRKMPRAFLDAGGQHSRRTFGRYIVAVTLVVLLLGSLSAQDVKPESHQAPAPGQTNSANPSNGTVDTRSIDRFSSATPDANKPPGPFEMPIFGNPLMKAEGKSASKVGLSQTPQVKPKLPVALPNEPSPFPGFPEPNWQLRVPKPVVAPTQNGKYDQDEPTLPKVAISATQKDKDDQGQVPPEQRAILGAGRAAAARGDLKVAISRFQEYLTLNPKDVKVRHEFAGLLVRAQEWKEAIGQFDLVVQALPNEPSIRIDLANVYLQIKQPKLAIPQLLAALKASPKETEVATQLARAYLGFKEPQNARQVFDRLLTDVKPTDAKIPSRFGRLLLDLKRPRQALPFLQELSLRNANDLELLTESIHAHAWLGNYDEATRLIAELATREPDNIKIRLELGDTLYRLTEFNLAGLVYEQALSLERNQARASLSLARVQVQMYNIESAAKLIEAANSDAAPPGLLALVRGELYLAVGKHAEAIKVLRAYLNRDEDDIECRAALAKVYEVTTDLEKAKAEWAKLGLLPGETVASGTGLAQTLALQRLFLDSNAMCNYVLAEEPDNAKATAQLIYNYGQMRQVDMALQLGRAYILGSHEHDMGVVLVGMALGRALLENNRFVEALVIYETIAAKPHGRKAVASFGQFYARHRMGNTAEGRQLLQPALEGNIRDRMELADIAAVFNVNDLVIELCNSVLATNPSHLPALLRRGQAELRLATLDANIAAAVNTANLILKISPTNVGGRLILARAFAIPRWYSQAFLEYHKLIKTDPDLMQVRKELARALFQANAYGLSDSQYSVGQYPSGIEVLREAQNYLAHSAEVVGQPPPAWSPIPLPSSSSAIPALPQETAKQTPSNNSRGVLNSTPPVAQTWSIPPLANTAAAPTPTPLDLALAGAPAAALTGQSAQVRPNGIVQAGNKPKDSKAQSALDLVPVSAQKQGQPEPLQIPRPVEGGDFGESQKGAFAKDAAELEAEAQRKQRRVAIAVEARAAEARALEQEQYAMRLKDLRYHQAVGAFGAVVASQPDNTSAMFSLAEQYGALGLTRAAIGMTNEVLAADRYHRDAAVMLDWATMTLQPRARAQLDISEQRGRNGLTSTELNKYTLQGVCPYGDEGDFVGLGYSRIAYIPRGYPALVGNMPTLLFGKQIGDSMQFVLDLNYEEYPDRFSDRPTFNALLRWDMNDCWRAHVGGFLRNVYDNGASIAQDIYRGGMELGSALRFTRDLDAAASYRLSGYSDGNLGHDALANFSVRLMPAPYELKFISSVQLTSFEESNVLSGTSSIELPGNIVPVDFEHPYFAPRGFFYFEERLAYKQTLSRDLFKYSDHFYYLLEYGLGFDNREAIYHNFRAGLHYDVNLWLTFGLNGLATISQVYDAFAGMAFVELRWPPHCKH